MFDFYGEKPYIPCPKCGRDFGLGASREGFVAILCDCEEVQELTDNDTDLSGSRYR